MVAEVVAVSDAVKALSGVAAGGLVGTLLTIGVTAARERGKTRKEDAATLELIIFELGNAQRGARYIRAGDPYTAFPITAWEESRIRLARSLEREAWMLVAGAYNAVHGFNWRYQHDQDSGPEGEKLLTDETERNRICDDIMKATAYALPVLRQRA